MKVSVVVPTFRRPELLWNCLRKLQVQDFPAHEFEICVADDDGESPIRRLVESVEQSVSGGPAFRYLPVTGSHGPAAARNRGWRAARGEIIAFTDDDTLPEALWLREGVQVFSDTRVWAATGRVVMPLPKFPSDYERNESGLTRAEFVTANCFCRRRILDAIGGFDERFTVAWREDSDLHFSLIRLARDLGLDPSRAIVQVPLAVVVHPIRPAPWGIALKQQRKSMFNALLYKKHPKLYRRKIQALPPWHYYVGILACLAALGCVVQGEFFFAQIAAGIWFLFTGSFFAHRLRGASRQVPHVLELAVTSVLIPWLAVFWRIRGAFRFRVFFFGSS